MGIIKQFKLTMNNKLLAEEIKQILNDGLDNIVRDVIIFGSRVKGNAQKDSDYDVLIITSCELSRAIQRKISDLCYNLELKYDIFLDTQTISTHELENGIRGQHPVFIDAIREGVHA